MFIEKTEQNLIKISFNANEEELYIADMLKIASSGNNGMVAQVVKLESMEENNNFITATAKIIFTILNNGKLNNWQGNIPAKDFKINIMDVEELLAVTGTGNAADPVLVGQLSCSPETAVNINASSLEHPSLVVGDKESTKTHFLSLLAYQLADKKSKVVIVDTNGDFLDLEGARILQAGKHVKLPLDIVGLENLYNKTLASVSAETKANIENIFSEIEEYLLSGEIKHIPFSSFLDAINDEYQANGTPELSFLNNSLAKLYRKGLFANNQKEINQLFASLKQNDLIVLDLSEVEDTWKEDFVDTILRLNKDVFKKNFYLINNLTSRETAKKLLNQGVKSGIKPVFAVHHESEIISEILSKIENIFALTAFNNSKVLNLQPFLHKLGDSEAIICGKITNNVPVYIKIAGLEEEYPEIIIDQSFAEAQEQIEQVHYKEQEVAAEPEEYQEQELYQEQGYEGDEEQLETNIEETEETYQDEYQQEDVQEVQYEEQSEQQDAEYQNDLNLMFDDEEATEKVQEDSEQYYTQEYSENVESEGDDDFDYSASEEFQDESVLDYINSEETEETYEPQQDEQQYTQQFVTQSAEQEFTEDDLHNFMDYEESEEAETIEEIQETAETPRKTSQKMPGPPTQDLPVYNVSNSEPDNNVEDNGIELNEGDTVRHKKYGVGTIKKVIGYSERKLCSIQFEEVGRRLLDPKLAELELVSKIK